MPTRNPHLDDIMRGIDPARIEEDKKLAEYLQELINAPDAKTPEEINAETIASPTADDFARELRAHRR